MFCPSCGSEQLGQYCRSCGTDLRTVRTALEKPEVTTASAISARNEICRAVADKIREMKSAKDMSKVLEEILPQIEKYLETPEEKRLRRIRVGTITAAIGAGVAIAFYILGVISNELPPFVFATFGLIIFLLGLGLVLNGWHFTIPENREIDQAFGPVLPTAKEPMPNQVQKVGAEERLFSASAIEHTTHQLTHSQLRTRESKLELRDDSDENWRR